jgi:hypothetical protein
MQLMRQIRLTPPLVYVAQSQPKPIVTGSNALAVWRWHR